MLLGGPCTQSDEDLMTIRSEFPLLVVGPRGRRVPFPTSSPRSSYRHGQLLRPGGDTRNAVRLEHITTKNTNMFTNESSSGSEHEAVSRNALHRIVSVGIFLAQTPEDILIGVPHAPAGRL